MAATVRKNRGAMTADPRAPGTASMLETGGSKSGRFLRISARRELVRLDQNIRYKRLTRILLVRIDYILHQPVPHNIAALQLHHADAFDPFELHLRIDQAAL